MAAPGVALGTGSRAGPIAVRALPFAVFIGWIAARPLLSGWVGPAWAPWLYAGQAGSALLLLLVFARHYEELRQWSARTADWLWAVAQGVAVFVAWIHLDLPWLSLGQGAGVPPPQTAAGPDWAWLAIRLAGAALVVPVMEELFWRSFVMRWIQNPDFRALAPAAVGLRAILLSSLVFGVEHALWFAGVLAGLAYAWLYRRSGNLWVPIVSHALTNLLLGLWVIATGAWQFW